MMCQGFGVILAGLLLASESWTDREEEDPSAYLIEAPDVLSIEVSVLPKKAEPISGEHLVRPDGTISLGAYGSVPVAGLTLDQARTAVVTHLADQVKKKRRDRLETQIEVTAFNSKVYYVLCSGEIYRLPMTGAETVLQAVNCIEGAAETAAQSSVWIVRPATDAHPDQILPVDWDGIVHHGRTATNYLILPGDRVYVGDSPSK